MKIGDRWRSIIVFGAAAAAAILGMGAPALGQGPQAAPAVPAPPETLFTNVRVFDGRAARL
jgi:hypothetical protein